MAKKKRTDLAVEVRRLRGKIQGLKAKVDLWQSLCLIVAAGSSHPPKVGTVARQRALAAVRGKAGGYLEDYVLSHDPVIRRSIEAADREYRKKGGKSLEEVIRGLKIRGKIKREQRMKLLRRSGKEI